MASAKPIREFNSSGGGWGAAGDECQVPLNGSSVTAFFLPGVFVFRRRTDVMLEAGLQSFMSGILRLILIGMLLVC